MCPGCAAPLSSSSTSRLIPPTERVSARQPTRLTEPLIGQAQATGRLSRALTGKLSRSISSGRAYSFVGVGVVVLLLIGGLWLNRNQALLSKVTSSSLGFTANLRANETGASDELVQLVMRSLENNLITSSANPLLTPDDRKALIVRALAELQEPRARQQAARNHQALAEELKQRGLGKDGWYEHVAACQKICLAAFSTITSRHFSRVGESVHNVIFFPVGSSQLDPASRRDVQLFAALMRNRMYAHRNILLIGRASRGGAHSYNLALAERRVQAVKSELIHSKVKPERIKILGLGGDRPYLTRQVAKSYRIPPYLFNGDEMRLNQSVEVVLY
jgi:outer membrane protein OmpA-like peptidoglycan-associated protein